MFVDEVAGQVLEQVPGHGVGPVQVLEPHEHRVISREVGDQLEYGDEQPSVRRVGLVGGDRAGCEPMAERRQSRRVGQQVRSRPADLAEEIGERDQREWCRRRCGWTSPGRGRHRLAERSRSRSSSCRCPRHRPPTRRTAAHCVRRRSPARRSPAPRVVQRSPLLAGGHARCRPVSRAQRGDTRPTTRRSWSAQRRVSRRGSPPSAGLPRATSAGLCLRGGRPSRLALRPT